MNVLIIGGSSGLGLEIGKLLLAKGAAVFVTGRSAKQIPEKLTFIELDITQNVDRLKEDLDKKLDELPLINLIIYAAGFLEKGHIAELADDHIVKMINIGLTAPALILQRIIGRQKNLDGFIAITSTSQWIPRELEPVYTGIKAGLGMLAQSISLDQSVKKTLVTGPAGMDTNFWFGSGRDTTGLLSPQWVAGKILELWKDDYVYRLARILRDPERVQIIETRDIL